MENIFKIVVSIIILTVGLTIIFGLTDPMASGTAQTDTITLSNLTYVALTQSPLVAGSETITNASDSTKTMTTGYTMNNTDGGILVSGASAWNDTLVNVAYRYQGSTYVQSTIGRTIVDNLPILFAVAILGFIGLAVYSKYS